jgi:hypothetical protein
VLGRAETGAMAFVRCLSPEVAERLAGDPTFAPDGWQVFRVADTNHPQARTITADRAVELREAKGEPVLLLVDTARAGAGMDGIYSAAQEVQEKTLFSKALGLAARELARVLTREAHNRAEQALKRARRRGRGPSLSYWNQLDFLVRAGAARRDPGELLYLLGLWPARPDPERDWADVLDLSWLFVDRLLGPAAAALTPLQRIESLRLLDPSDRQREDLEELVRSAATKPLRLALEALGEKEHLWIGALRTERAAQAIREIELVPWRAKTGQIGKWSGLREEDPNLPPVFILKPDAERTGDYSKLEVRWKARPENLERGAVTYRVAVLTDMEEEIAVREVPHTGKKAETCRFTNDDFSSLQDDALISAKVRVSAIGSEVEPKETEELTIRFGEPPEREKVGGASKVRTFSEGLIELADREAVSAVCSAPSALREDSRGFVLLGTSDRGKRFRVFRPALIRDVEAQWKEQPDSIGRWRVKVRTSGARVGEPEFVPFSRDLASTAWDRAANASRRMAQRFAASGGGVGQVYDDGSKEFETAKEYLLAWETLLEQGDPLLALAHTVEVQTLSGRTVGLIVLPSHPLRVAWHVAYDNLVLYTAFHFKDQVPPKHVREELKILDGSMFPAFLPGLERGHSFAFADTLGFHAVGMVADGDQEPKASIAILARALGEVETADVAPTVGRQSAEVLANEIQKYIECHGSVRRLHLHALRPGDGLTIARSLGRVLDRYSVEEDTPGEPPTRQHARDAVLDRYSPSVEEDADDGHPERAPSFVLELYPSPEQRAVAGRFIAEAREKRRRGAGVLAPEDHWMLDSVSLPGGVSLPRLRWARKDETDPTKAAHLAVAFDTFDSKVVLDVDSRPRPLFAYGLLSFFERHYTDEPSPCWRSTVPPSREGEKHPSDRTHSERLARLQEAVFKCVARNLAGDGARPILRTEISPEKAHTLRELHRLCDWVITLDRNAGVEYFDSPKTNREIYDAYVIDCVPEREDLGCLQLITSTSNLEEVRNLLDRTLDQMGLSQSRRNAEFLLEHLKALSGRLAIRLTGQKTAPAEMIALSLSHAHCVEAEEADPCWTPLRKGFFIPVDDVRDLLAPFSEAPSGGAATEARPDLIYVSQAPRRGLVFQFLEVKYRRHLRTARSAEVLDGIQRQIASLRARWEAWYSTENVPPPLGAVRRAKLARVLRFYADKARRHDLEKEPYDRLVAEIDRMIEKGGEYSFGRIEWPDRGWVFCPEYGGASPLEIFAGDGDTRIFLFGPGVLPDSDFRRETMEEPFPTPPALVDADRSASPPPPEGQNEGASGTASPMAAGEETSRPAVAALPDPGFPRIVLGTDSRTGNEVFWPLTTQGNPHLLVAGLPGMGKTTCLINLCEQMLVAGIRPIVFSYHQDIDQRLQEARRPVRLVDFRGLGFNPLQVIDRQSPKAYLDVAGALRDIFVAIYPELGDLQGERIRRAIRESFQELGWRDEAADVAALPEPPFARFLEILRSEPRPDRGLRTLLGRLEELADYGFFDLGDSCESLWDSDGITILRIHATQNDNLQKAFASLVFYGLYKDMFRRGIQSRITHAVIFDEAHRAARLRLIPTMAKECRKFGISLVLASQEAKDFNISLFSAIANYLVLRLNDTDAKALVRNVASSDQERALIDRIKQMDRFWAFYFCEGRRKPSLVRLLYR